MLPRVGAVLEIVVVIAVSVVMIERNYMTFAAGLIPSMVRKLLSITDAKKY